MMKTVKVSELKTGDIFAKEIKLVGREAFQVVDPVPEKDYTIVKSRNTFETKKMMIKRSETVYLLRHEDVIM